MNFAYPAQPATILVVDDEPMLRNLICRFLQSKNQVTIEAANGTEALKLTRTRGIQPNLLITDITMPEMGGIKLLQELRRYDEDLPALLVSGFCDDPEELDSLLDEHTRFLEKPFNFKMLEVELNRLLPSSPDIRRKTVSKRRRSTAEPQARR